MTADEIRSAYAEQLSEVIIVRRYAAGTGAGKPKFDAQCRGKAWGYTAKELIGTIQQGDTRVLVLVEDLITRGFPLPVTANDFVVVKGKQIAIISPGTRKAPDGVIVVYDLQARG